MLELYHAHKSTCSQRVRMALAEKQLDYVSRPVDLAVGEQLSDWYLKLNPHGVVPTLVHDGWPVTDSSVINEYLDETFPDHPLAPSDPRLRARMRSIRQFVDEVPTAAIRIPSLNAYIIPMMGKDANFFDEKARKNAPLRKAMMKKIGPKGFSDSDTADAMDQLRHACEFVDKALADGPWLVGETFSLADIGLTPIMVRIKDLQLDGSLWAGLSNLPAWFARIEQRPSFAKAYYDGTQMGVLQPAQSEYAC